MGVASCTEVKTKTVAEYGSKVFASNRSTAYVKQSMKFQNFSGNFGVHLCMLYA